MPDTFVAMDASITDPRRPGPLKPREDFLTALNDWVGLTASALFQARYNREIAPTVDVRAVAIQIHQLLWGNGWTSSVYGSETSARVVLRAIWKLLRRIASDATIELPEPSRFFDQVKRYTTGRIVRTDDESAVPSWRLFLTPSEPLFHAFVRHELIGDPRTFLDEPELVLEDLAAADAYVPSSPHSDGETVTPAP